MRFQQFVVSSRPSVQSGSGSTFFFKFIFVLSQPIHSGLPPLIAIPLRSSFSSHHFVDRRLRKMRASIGTSGSLKPTADCCGRTTPWYSRSLSPFIFLRSTSGTEQTGHQVIDVNHFPYAGPVLRADTSASHFQRNAALTRLLRSSPASNSRATLKARSVFV